MNLTDGLDGLATGACVMVFGAYMLVNIWQNNQSCGADPGATCYEVRDPLDLAVVAAAITGACFGFLWWNASPAAIFMGDTGSLVARRRAGRPRDPDPHRAAAGHPRRPVRGRDAVGDAAGRLLQGTERSPGPGKRIFRMAPLHHHFEMLGWEQVTVVIRFWIITGLCVAAGLGIFYAEWVAGL